jgi:hypothetical protein
MSLNESSATALVRFTGLGIICFNKERQRGEIAAIRDNKHQLTIKIQGPAFVGDDNSDLLRYKDITSYEKLPNEDVRIEITASGKPPIAGYEVYQAGDFDRLESDDKNDFRWIVNMNSLHGNAPLSVAAEPHHPLAKIYIGNGLFYTHSLDTNLFFEKVEKDASGIAARREVFGNVGETIGVKIEGEEVNVTIRVGKQEETHTLKRVEGLPFRIEIKNMDSSPDAVYSDMADYYRYLSSPGDSQFDLAPIVEGDEKSAAGGSVNTSQFCHPVSADDPPSIDNF